MPATYPQNVRLYIDGAWCAAAEGGTIPVHNPATDVVLGSVSHARKADLERALAAAGRGFEVWRRTSPL
jgi:succinate-semialdehyde dehydrogenase/glutarate-semialdehyde dehydrogenase